MTRCGWCHKESRDLIDSRDILLRRAGLIGKGIPLPSIGK